MLILIACTTHAGCSNGGGAISTASITPQSSPAEAAGTAVSPEPGTSGSTNVKSKKADPTEPAFGSKEFWDSDAASQGK
jgi:hypothetical protein